jgi:hypothetical protein
LRPALTPLVTTTTGVVGMGMQCIKLSNNAEPTEGGVDFKYQSRTELQFGTIDDAWTQREIALYCWACQLEKEVASARDSASILADAVQQRY